MDTSRIPATAPPWHASALSTPAGLKLTIVVAAITVGVFGITASRAAIERRAVADAVVESTAPILLRAQDLYVALANADAAASSIFLRAGLEPPDLRARYLEDIRRAGARLAAIAVADLGPDAAGAVATLAEELPVYTGLIEAARANSRQGYPVGAAYLRRASDLMRSTILPAATAIYRDAAVKLDDRYQDGTARSVSHAVAMTCAGAIVALGLAQLYVTSRSRRWLNVGLVVATLVVAGAATATLLVLGRQADALAESRDDGADLVTTLSTMRILTLRSLSDENLDLIERGTAPEYLEDFDRLIRSVGIGATFGLLDRAEEAAPDTATRDALAVLEDRYDEYLAAHDEVRQLDDQDQYRQAVDVAVGREVQAAGAVDGELSTIIDRSSGSLLDDADRARDLVPVLSGLVALAAVAAALAVVIGLQPRLQEYR